MTNKQNLIFDEIADDYNTVLNKSISISGEDSSFFAELKIKLMYHYFKKIQRLHILDYGCGIGNSTPFLSKYFPDSKISGTDPSFESIKIAKKNYPQQEFFVINEQMEIKQNKFDLIFSACVFHHIDPKERLNTLTQISNLLDKDGYFVLFEHNPYNPITVNIVKNSPIDEGVILLNSKYSKLLFQNAGLKVEGLYYYFFFPKFLSFMRPCEKFMHFLPFGGQYMLIGRKVKK